MTEKIIVPNLEAKTSEGNAVFAPRLWLERFRQFTKQEHKIDIAPPIKGEEITNPDGPEKKDSIKKISFWECFQKPNTK